MARTYSTRRRRQGVILAVALLGLALGILLARRGGEPRPPEPATEAARPPARADAPPGARADARADREAEVAAIVRRANAREARQGPVFLAAGWSLVSAPEPDPRVLDLDPTLLATDEAALAAQMASAVVRRDHVPALRTIATRADRPETRFRAVEALGRIPGPEAADAMLELLFDTALDPTEPARQNLAARLVPDSLDDPLAATLARLLDDPRLSEVDKDQLAFTLAVVGARDRSELPEEVTTALTETARARLLAKSATLESPGVDHAHGDHR